MVPVRLKRSGMVMRLVLETGQAASCTHPRKAA